MIQSVIQEYKFEYSICKISAICLSPKDIESQYVKFHKTGIVIVFIKGPIQYRMRRLILRSHKALEAREQWL